MARTLALTAALLFICLLAFLTVSTLIDEGLNVAKAAVSLLILALFGLGVVGALTTPPDD